MLVAIVEDDKKLNLSIKNILNYDVDTFFDSNSFLNSNKLYDLAIIDIKLKNKNGLDLIGIAKKTIIISANITPENLNIAYKKGAVDFIKKPFFKEELLNKINILFPKKLYIKNYYLDLDNLTFNNIFITKSEAKFLSLFQKEIVTFDEILLELGFSETGLYSFISRLKKKININFKNIKGIGYKILI